MDTAEELKIKKQMIQKENYLKAKEIVEKYEDQLRIAEVMRSANSCNAYVNSQIVANVPSVNVSKRIEIMKRLIRKIRKAFANIRLNVI